MKLLSALLIAASLVLPATAQESATQQLMKLSFDTTDEDRSGQLTLAEMITQTDKIFSSMDENDDGNATQQEFLVWDFGFRNIAEDQGKLLALDSSMTLVFDYWDRDNDQLLHVSELQQGIVRSFQYADVDGSSQLSVDEYIKGFIANLAVQSALN